MSLWILLTRLLTVAAQDDGGGFAVAAVFFFLIPVAVSIRMTVVVVCGVGAVSSRLCRFRVATIPA